MIKLTDHFDTTIAVEWDVKPQIKTKKSSIECFVLVKRVVLSDVVQIVSVVSSNSYVNVL